MSGKTTDCAEIRERMFGVASDSLSVSIRAAFDAHIGKCAACAKEFRHVQILAQAINHSLSACLSVEPSPQLLANVRRQMIAEPHRALPGWQWSGWLKAAGVCAALAILIFAARSAFQFNRPTQSHTAASINVRLASRPSVRSRLTPDIEAAADAQPRKPVHAFVAQAPRRAPLRKAGEPEIIVQPGQMEAILRFAAAAESGQIDGTKLLADQKNAAEPLTIKPLVIPPLNAATLDDETAAPSGKDDGGNKDFVAGHLN